MRKYTRNAMISYLKIVVIELTFTRLYTPDQIMGKMGFTVGKSFIAMLSLWRFLRYTGKKNEVILARFITDLPVLTVICILYILVSSIMNIIYSS